LVDLNLPDSAGYETFLRVQEQGDGVPIVVLTGDDDDGTAVQAMKDRVLGYLSRASFNPSSSCDP